MLGWFTAASVFASRSNRASRSGSSANEAGQHLDGDLAVEIRIERVVDLTHAARADLGGDLVWTKATAKGHSHGKWRNYRGRLNRADT